MCLRLKKNICTEQDIDDFLGKLNPLDLILVDGITPFSKLIKKGSKLVKGNGQFSHCGLVINKEICPEIDAEVEDDYPLLMESTVSIFGEVPDIETGKFSLGAQIRDLREVIKELLADGGSIAVCHLKKNPYVEAKSQNDEVKIESIKKAIDSIYNTYFEEKSIYELNIFSLLGTIFPSVRPLRDATDKMMKFITENHPWIFCSELVCIVYRDLDLLEDDIDTQAYLPVDFVSSIDFTNPQKTDVVNSIMDIPPIFIKYTSVENKKCTIL